MIFYAGVISAFLLLLQMSSIPSCHFEKPSLAAVEEQNRPMLGWNGNGNGGGGGMQLSSADNQSSTPLVKLSSVMALKKPSSFLYCALQRREKEGAL